jgi:hypothetical protein
MEQIMADPTPKLQLDAFIAKYDPKVAAETKKVLAAMRRRLPGMLELVYDNYNALAIGFGPSERASEVVFSIAVYPRWISLFFFNGAKLKDPKKLLKGKGNQARHIVLTDGAESLADPDVRALMDQALKRAPFDAKLKRRLIIKSISEKQRPRRPAAGSQSRL